MSSGTWKALALLLLMAGLTAVEADDTVPTQECAGQTTVAIGSKKIAAVTIRESDWIVEGAQGWRCLRIVTPITSVQQIGLQRSGLVGDVAFTTRDSHQNIPLTDQSDPEILWSAVLPGGEMDILVRTHSIGEVDLFVRADIPVPVPVPGTRGGVGAADLVDVTPPRRARPMALPSQCHIDAQCGIAGLEAYSDAVALLIFRKNGNFAMCTGTKISDVGFSGIPYILTADHCISTQAEADTLSTFWRFRSSSCNGPVPDLTSLPYTNFGSILRTKNTALDMALLELPQPAPAGVRALDWSNSPLGAINIATIGHPGGEQQAIGFGTVNAVQSNGRFAVLLAQGVLSPGASGSTIVDGQGLVRGVLGQANINDQYSCGGVEVANQTFGGSMGAFYAQASPWLDPFGVRNTTQPNPSPNPNPNPEPSGGGGSLDGASVFLLLFLSLARRLRANVTTGLAMVAVLPPASAQDIQSSAAFRYARGDGFNLYERVYSSDCPAAFRQAWDSDYKHLQKTTDVLEEWIPVYEAEKAKLLADTVWWGAPAWSTQALKGTEAIHGIKMAADAILTLMPIAPGAGAYKYSYRAYKVATTTKDIYAYAGSLEEGEVAAATYEAADMLEFLPKSISEETKAVIGVALAMEDVRESRKDFDAYRSELKVALQRFDTAIADVQGQIKRRQAAFSIRTERGLKDFCNDLGALVAQDDQVRLDFRRTPEVCIPVRDNDTEPTGEGLLVISAGVRKRPAGSVAVADGGRCVLYRAADPMPIPFNDEFDYEVQDARGRRARATVRVAVTSCSLDPLQEGGPAINYCSKEVPAPVASTPSVGTLSRPPIVPTPELPQAVAYCEPGLIEVDGSCWTPERARGFLNAKCDPEYGWGTCTTEQVAAARGATPSEVDLASVSSSTDKLDDDLEGVPKNGARAMAGDDSAAIAEGQPTTPDPYSMSDGSGETAANSLNDGTIYADASDSASNRLVTNPAQATVENSPISAGKTGVAEGVGGTPNYDPNGYSVSIPPGADRSKSPLSIVRDGICLPSPSGWVQCYERRVDSDSRALPLNSESNLSDSPVKDDPDQGNDEAHSELERLSALDLLDRQHHGAVNSDSALAEANGRFNDVANSFIATSLTNSGAQMMTGMGRTQSTGISGAGRCDPQLEQAVAARLQACSTLPTAGNCDTLKRQAACLEDVSASASSCPRAYADIRNTAAKMRSSALQLCAN